MATAFETAGYRDAPATPVPPIVVRYVPLTWYELVRFGTLAALITVMVCNAPPERLATLLLGACGVTLLLAAVALPVVRLAARIEGGHVVVRGCRWPGAEVTWSCPLREAEAFELVVVYAEAGNKPHLQVALRTAEPRVLALTEHAYRGTPYPRVLRRMNAWLDSARDQVR